MTDKDNLCRNPCKELDIPEYLYIDYISREMLSAVSCDVCSNYQDEDVYVVDTNQVGGNN